MLIIVCLTLAVLICLILVRKIKKIPFYFLTLGIMIWWIAECIVYAYFLLLIYQGSCFYLIGHQKGLDALIKGRLIYSMYFAASKKSFINRVDDTLGFTLGTNKEAGPYQTNWQGFRDSEEVPLHSEEDTLRVATFGNSVIYGAQVTNEQTWQHQLESFVENLEVLNFGVPGHNLGQYYLRYIHDALQFNPDVITFNGISTGHLSGINPKAILTANNLRQAHFYLVRFWIEDGILKSRGISPYDFFDKGFRDQYIFGPFDIDPDEPFGEFKMLTISNIGLLFKQLAVKENALEAVKNDVEQSSTDEIDQKILENLLETAKQQGSVVIFFIPKPFDKLPLFTQELLNEYQDTVIYVDAKPALEDQFRSHGIEDISQYRVDATHYSKEGHTIYAETILEILKSQPLKTRKGTFTFSSNKNKFLRK